MSRSRRGLVIGTALLTNFSLAVGTPPAIADTELQLRNGIGGYGRGAPDTMRIEPPKSFAVAGDGTVYAAQSSAIRAFDPATGSSKVVAGVPAYAVNEWSQVPTKRLVAYPDDLAIDAHDNLLFSSPFDDRVSDAVPTDYVVRVLTRSAGDTYGVPRAAARLATVMGGGPYGRDGVRGTQARLVWVTALAASPSGLVTVFDRQRRLVRVMPEADGAPFGVAMSAGRVYTAIGGGTLPLTDDMRAADVRLPVLRSLAFTPDEALLFTDELKGTLWASPATSGRYFGRDMTAGRVYLVAGTGNPDDDVDDVPSRHARLINPSAVTVSPDGTVVLTGPRLWPRESALQFLTAASGTKFGRSVEAGRVYQVPIGLLAPKVASSQSGDIYFTYYYGVSILADESGTAFGQPVTAGEMVKIAGSDAPSLPIDGLPNAWLEGYINRADTTLAGDVVTESALGLVFSPGTSGSFFGKTMTPGLTYRIGGGASASRLVDGALAATSSIGIHSDLTFDNDGNVVVGLWGELGVIARSDGTFYGRAMRAGHYHSITPASMSSSTLGVHDLEVHPDGHILLMSWHQVHVLATADGSAYGLPLVAGELSLLAGDPESTGTYQSERGDGGPAIAANLDMMRGLSVGPDGTIVVSDWWGQRLRAIADVDSTVFGVPVLAGHIDRIGGGGTGGVGDPLIDSGFPSVRAQFDSTGNLLVTQGTLQNPGTAIHVVSPVDRSAYGLSLQSNQVTRLIGDTRELYTASTYPAAKATLTGVRLVLEGTPGTLWINDQSLRRIS